MTKLTKEARDALTDDQFAVPSKRLLPLHDEKHVRMAFGNIKTLPKEFRDDARLRIAAAATELNVTLNTSGRAPDMTLSCMSLEMPDVEGHPNKRAFRGVLCRLDEQSDAAPNGSGGRTIVVTRWAAEMAIASLLGMGVGFTDSFDGHDVKRKIGIIESADIEGNALFIHGYFYAADFPDEVQAIIDQQSSMGFSFEAQQIVVDDTMADPLVISRLTFTGAAVLLKDKAAYKTTSLAANAAGDPEMTKEEIEALVASAVKSAVDKNTADVSAKFQAEIDGLKEKAAIQAAAADTAGRVIDNLRANAEELRKAGIGIADHDGIVAHLHKIANVLAEGTANGRLPQTYVVQAAAGVQKTDDKPDAKTEDLLKQIADLKASIETLGKDQQLRNVQAAGDNVQRKTVAVQSIMARTGLQASEDGTVTIDQVDAAFNQAGLFGQQAIQAKLALKAAGALR